MRTKRTGDCIIKNYIKYLQNVDYNVKKDVHFHLTLLGVPSSMIMSVKNWGWGLSFT